MAYFTLKCHVSKPFPCFFDNFSFNHPSFLDSALSSHPNTPIAPPNLSPLRRNPRQNFAQLLPNTTRSSPPKHSLFLFPFFSLFDFYLPLLATSLLFLNRKNFRSYPPLSLFLGAKKSFQIRIYQQGNIYNIIYFSTFSRFFAFMTY